MIRTADVLLQHSRVVALTGGADGVRDLQILDSALSRPFQTFGGEALYPELIQKAAALIESIVANHPFVDGNKRTGYTVMRTFLRVNDHDLTCGEDERYDFVIAIASGELRYEGIVSWLQANTGRLQRQ